MRILIPVVMFPNSEKRKLAGLDAKLCMLGCSTSDDVRYSSTFSKYNHGRARTLWDGAMDSTEYRAAPCGGDYHGSADQYSATTARPLLGGTWRLRSPHHESDQAEPQSLDCRSDHHTCCLRLYRPIASALPGRRRVPSAAATVVVVGGHIASLFQAGTYSEPQAGLDAHSIRPVTAIWSVGTPDAPPGMDIPPPTSPRVCGDCPSASPSCPVLSCVPVIVSAAVSGREQTGGR